ncbi:hypothetical protein [Leifsonia sp. Leaf264]|uniref:hypothetical protein n=1 Tax=Leifsonia sp. Leaf264 TaxID=1736314 RepID=UPI0006FA4D86|nr:hypothetical protein [Leifsonia sp. Leaf264]KQO98365.1 hypothetical protein ASF30_09910 [Leifsonia sp. Leaf264]
MTTIDTSTDDDRIRVSDVIRKAALAIVFVAFAAAIIAPERREALFVMMRLSVAASAILLTWAVSHLRTRDSWVNIAATGVGGIVLPMVASIIWDAHLWSSTAIGAVFVPWAAWMAVTVQRSRAR